MEAFEVFESRYQNIFYVLSLVFLAIAAVVFAAVRVTGISLTDYLPGCVFLRYTGYYCPGCGGTRAIIFMFQGKFLKSFLYHPLVLYSACVFVSFVSGHTVRLITSGRHGWGSLREIHFYIAVALLFGNWFLKNILIYFHLWS